MLTKRNNAPGATVTTLNTKIEELEGEFAVYRVVLGKWVLNATLSHKIDVPKLEKFKGARSTVERRGHATIGTWEEFQKEFKEQFYPQYGEKKACAKFRQFSQ
ncbi:hypothetical protein CXB51_007968 [Gossypium anomalum]|uniref:Retrotransposon gag domain-containing protein n=1 Tax=Gossypium anomalum TaxID=47600 RepID=A0A8J5ZCP6_9ROSI|nr:hypothetical protein CXB51_007968 [Gossypium anomalum]